VSVSSEIKEEIYDMAIKAGSSLLQTNRSTISKLLEVFHSETDPVSGVKLLYLHTARQMNRRELKGNVQLLLSHLKIIYDGNKDKPDTLRNLMEKYLTLLKWVHEFSQRPCSNFEELLSRR
jgi:hypothetical protein